MIETADTWWSRWINHTWMNWISVWVFYSEFRDTATTMLLALQPAYSLTRVYYYLSRNLLKAGNGYRKGCGDRQFPRACIYQKKFSYQNVPKLSQICRPDLFQPCQNSLLNQNIAIQWSIYRNAMKYLSKCIHIGIFMY